MISTIVLCVLSVALFFAAFALRSARRSIQQREYSDALNAKFEAQRVLRSALEKGEHWEASHAIVDLVEKSIKLSKLES